MKLQATIEITNYGKGKIMKKGICDTISYLILACLQKVVTPIMSEEEAPDPFWGMCQWELFFQPKGWKHIINHYFLIFNCKDGVILIDCPMKEYSYHDGKWYYFNGVTTPSLWSASSSRELEEMWDITPTEAKKQATIIKSWEKEDFYQIDMYKDQFLALIQGKPWVDPRQLDLFL